MKRLRIAQKVCGIFPPIVSQLIRDMIYPLAFAVEEKADFSIKSVTGSTFLGNTMDFHSYKFAVHRFFEWRNVIIADFFLNRQSGDIVEIGANVGTETVSYCDVTKPKGNVHAFEPLPQNIADLEQLKNHLENLIIYPVALSDHTTTVQFKVPPPTSSGTGKIVIEPQADQTNIINVDCAPLDSFQHQFSNIRFMSVDTEGHEPFVLRGALSIINLHQPAIVIEVSPKLLKKFSGSTVRDIHQFFTDANYVCMAINRFSLSIVNSDDLAATRSHNWLCVPEKDGHIRNKLSFRLLIRAVVPWYLLRRLDRRN